MSIGTTTSHEPTIGSSHASELIATGLEGFTWLCDVPRDSCRSPHASGASHQQPRPQDSGRRSLRDARAGDAALSAADVDVHFPRRLLQSPLLRCVLESAGTASRSDTGADSDRLALSGRRRNRSRAGGARVKRAVDYSGEAAEKLRAEGLLPVRSKSAWVGLYTAGDPLPSEIGIDTTRPATEAVCRTLAIEYRTAHTRPVGYKGAAEVWVAKNDLDRLRAVFDACRMLLYPSFPEMARRFKANDAVLREYMVAWRLGANEDTRLEILSPLKRPAKVRREPRL